MNPPATADPAQAAPTAEEITAASRSNLALAFIALSRERRADISVFYAFCRLVDDLADEPGPTADERQAAFAQWRQALRETAPGEHPLAPAVRRLIAKYSLDVQLLEEIIAGCEMDVARTVYHTWDDLRLYCYRVASAVGLVSIEIFGYRDPACREYAIQLGLALQVTNIIRDVGDDFQNDQRVYLPREEMERFGVTLEQLAAHTTPPELQRLLEFQARRAEELYAQAVAALPPGDRRSMIAAEIMRAVYSGILGKIQRGGYRVLEKRFRLNKLQKLACIAQVWFRTTFGLPPLCSSSET